MQQRAWAEPLAWQSCCWSLYSSAGRRSSAIHSPTGALPTDGARCTLNHLEWRWLGLPITGQYCVWTETQTGKRHGQPALWPLHDQVRGRARQEAAASIPAGSARLRRCRRLIRNPGSGGSVTNESPSFGDSSTRALTRRRSARQSGQQSATTDAPCEDARAGSDLFRMSRRLIVRTRLPTDGGSGDRRRRC